MPELPEVETVKNGLIEHCLKSHITNVIIHTEKLRYPLDQLMIQKITTQCICNISRRGKHLLIYLDYHALIIHLGMSGTLQIVDTTNYQLKKHDHIVLNLDNNQTIFYNDPRRFGYWHITENDPLLHKCFLNYGPEPLTKNFNTNYLKNSLNNRSQAIKSVIMNNRVVVGVGNIYACESLFKAGILPLKPAKHLTVSEIKKLVKTIKLILIKAIARGGTTLKDYKSFKGKPGYFAQSLQVYGQKDKICQICKMLIKSIVINQRNTFYCPRCQK